MLFFFFLSNSYQKPSDTQWNDLEISALIQYVALYHSSEDGTSVWPVHKRQDFWENCAKAVMQCSGGCTRSCKYKLVNV